MDGRSQVGLVCASSIDDYENDVIKNMNLPGPIKSLTELTILRLPVLKLEMCFLLIGMLRRSMR